MSLERIVVLGRLGMEPEGREAPVHGLPGRRAELVFAYLAVEHARRVSRDELANALWPATLPDSWTAALRGVVSDVRRFLKDSGVDPAEVLATGRRGYQLRLPAQVVVDIDEARAAIADAHIELAAGAPALAAAHAARAAALAQLQATDKGAAENELHKLLAYANYSRPITPADVAELSLRSGEHGDFFALADAVSAANGQRAMQALQPLLEERDKILLYFSMVGHFRALLQSRDLLDAGMGETDIAKQLRMHPYRAKKMAAQAKQFSSRSLRAIYERLLNYDEQIKTGEIEAGLAMQTFVAELSVQAAS